MRALILFFTVCALIAVEVGPLQVVRVVDGDTIIVKAETEGAEDQRVRLLWIDTPESKGNSHGAAMPEGVAASAFLTEKLPAKAYVTLWGPGEALETDFYKRTLALVIPQVQGWAMTKEHGCIPFYTAGTPIQEQMITAGWSPYWRKYGAAPEPWHTQLLTAQRAAEEVKAGAWGTADKWMRDKANERTSKK